VPFFLNDRLELPVVDEFSRHFDAPPRRPDHFQSVEMPHSNKKYNPSVLNF
jgi:hypothetical protein